MKSLLAPASSVIRRPPLAARRLLQEDRRSTASLTALAEIIESDPALLQSVLKHVNSAFYASGAGGSPILAVPAALRKLHEPLGGLAVLEWGLGEEASLAVAHHHRNPPIHPPQLLSELVFLAEKLDIFLEKGVDPELEPIWIGGRMTAPLEEVRPLWDDLRARLREERATEPNPDAPPPMGEEIRRSPAPFGADGPGGQAAVPSGPPSKKEVPPREPERTSDTLAGRRDDPTDAARGAQPPNLMP